MPDCSGFDLHCHSTRSDGVLAPGVVVARAAARGVHTLALTDHEETGGLDEARAAAQAVGLTLVNGVEISVSWNGRTLHVVGLRIDAAHPLLAQGLRRLRSGRHERAVRIAAGLEAAGIPGSLAGARSFVTNPELVGRAHFARYLLEQGRGRDLQAVFRNYLTEGRPGYVPHQWAELGEAVHWICASGGIAVLAHPGRYAMTSAAREALLGAFVDAGGAGIEVMIGSHSAQQCATWANYARRYGLLASSGSDFHGPDGGARDFGRLPGLPPGLRPVWERF